MPTNPADQYVMRLLNRFWPDRVGRSQLEILAMGGMQDTPLRRSANIPSDRLMSQTQPPFTRPNIDSGAAQPPGTGNSNPPPPNNGGGSNPQPNNNPKGPVQFLSGPPPIDNAPKGSTHAMVTAPNGQWHVIDLNQGGAGYGYPPEMIDPTTGVPLTGMPFAMPDGRFTK